MNGRVESRDENSRAEGRAMDSHDFSKQNMLLWWPVAWEKLLLTKSNSCLLLLNETVLQWLYGWVHSDPFPWNLLTFLKWNLNFVYMQDVDVFFFALAKNIPLHTDTSLLFVCVNEKLLTIVTDKAEIVFSLQSLWDVCTCLILSMKTSWKRQFEDHLSLQLAYMPKCTCSHMWSQWDVV